MVNNLPRRASRSEASQGEHAQSGRSSASMQALGAFLRERREAMGVSLAEVEVATRIRQKYLSALEADEWHLLPGEVVGRGFLRNYADYLGLEPQEVMERRRSVTEPNMTMALSSTSAGAPLPNERAVDYRPKEVDLKDDGDGIQRGEIRLTPILAILGVALVTVLGWWGLTALREPIGDMLADARVGVSALFDRPQVEPTNTVLGVVNTDNLNAEDPSDAEAGDAEEPGSEATGLEETAAGAASVNGDVNGGATATADGVIPLGSGSEGEGGSDAGGPGAEASDPADAAAPSGGGDNQENNVVLVPTNTPNSDTGTGDAGAGDAELAAPTPTPAQPTPTLAPPTSTPVPTSPPPTPTLAPPTPTPAETPTPEPTEAPAVVAPSCPDGRAVITSPGGGQVLSGMAGVSGSATHESFDYYKLEYAPGANAADGYVYFDGANVQVEGGLLGNFNTPSLPNGEYTIRLTVVDQTGNFPPPCTVSVVIQN